MSDQETQSQDTSDSAEQSTDKSGIPPEIKAAILGIVGSLGGAVQKSKRCEARAKCLEYALSANFDNPSADELVAAAKTFFAFITTDDESDKEASDEQG